MFDFELVHVPGAKHKRPDGLLRRRAIESKEEGKDVKEAESWVDEIIRYGIWVATWLEEGKKQMVNMG